MFRWSAVCTAFVVAVGCFVQFSSADLAADDGSGNSLQTIPTAKPDAAQSKAKTAQAGSGPVLPAPSAAPAVNAAPPATPASPEPADPAQADPGQSSPGLSIPGLNIPGIGQFLRPDGFDLPGGAGFIRRTPDHIGIHINTPDGPLEFTVPRRQRPPEDEGPPLDGDDANPRSRSRSAARANRAAREFASISRTFHSRNYPLALRRANRALERQPGDRDLKQLRSLVNVALGDYAAAYRDASAVLAEDDVWDWGTLRSLYHSADEYTAQYRALEDRALAHPHSSEIWFLLAYHNLMLGNRDAAHHQFERVAALDAGNETAHRLATGERPPQPRSDGPVVPAGGNGPLRSVPQARKSPRLTRPIEPTRDGAFGIDLGQPGTIAPPSQPDSKAP